MKIKIPEKGTMIEIGVLNDRLAEDDEQVKVVGIVESAEVRKKTKYFEHGLYVKFKKVIVVKGDFDAGMDAFLKDNKFPFYVWKGEWKYVKHCDVLGEVL